MTRCALVHVCQVLHNIFIHLHNGNWPRIAHLAENLIMFEAAWVACVFQFLVLSVLLVENVAVPDLGPVRNGIGNGVALVPSQRIKHVHRLQ